MIVANGQRFPWHERLTARELLKTLGYNFPSVLLRVDGSIVRRKTGTAVLSPMGPRWKSDPS